MSDESPIMDFRDSVHRDETPCIQNATFDVSRGNVPTEWAPCPHIGTGLHEPIEEHLKRVHGYSEEVIHGIRLAARVLDVPGAANPDVATMFRIHDFIHLFEPAEEGS